MAPILVAAPVSDASHTGVGFWWRYVTKDAAVALNVQAQAGGFASYRIEAESSTREYALGFYVVDRDTGAVVASRLQTSDLLDNPPPPSCSLSYGHNLIVEISFAKAGNYTLVGFGTGPKTCEILFHFHDLGRTTWGASRTTFNTVSARLDGFPPTSASTVGSTGSYEWDAATSKKTLTATGKVFGIFSAQWPGACPTTPKGDIAVAGPTPLSGSTDYRLKMASAGSYAFTVDGEYSYAPAPIGGGPACTMGTAKPKITLAAADVVFP